MQAFTICDTELILLATAGFFFLVQIGYYLGLYSRINRHVVACKQGKIPHTQDLPPISVIICAHNEPENLRLNLEPVLRQDYPNYEVIVINDGNDDESDDLLTRLQQQYPHLYHSYVPHSPHGTGHRKLAVTLGIKASKHEWLVFTRPDSAPQSNQWLRAMARNFTPVTQVVLGYSNYGQPRNRGQRWATLCELFNAMRYLGFALGRHPYMGIGRNLAYRKELFYKNKGFSAHLNLPLGEDDLFINRIATPTNTGLPPPQTHGWRQPRNPSCASRLRSKTRTGWTKNRNTPSLQGITMARNAISTGLKPVAACCFTPPGWPPARQGRHTTIGWRQAWDCCCLRCGSCCKPSSSTTPPATWASKAGMASCSRHSTLRSPSCRCGGNGGPASSASRRT